MPRNTSSPYIESLTSLRGIAAWWIVFYHFRETLGLGQDNFFLQLIGKGFLAVDFFFILSGFVIFINYQSSFTHLSLPVLRDFLARRLARVYPLHLFILVIFLVNPLMITFFSSAANLGDRYDVDYYLASLLMIQNWGFFDHLAWNIPAWSISTEFGAYLAFPVLAIIFKKYFTSAIWHLTSILILCSSLAIIYKLNHYTSLGNGITDIGLIRCIIEFAMGSVIGHFFLNFKEKHRIANRSSILGVLLISSIAMTFNLPNYTFIPVIFAMIIFIVSIDPYFTKKALGGRILLYLGQISYSTYLVHFLIRDWVKFFSHQIGILQFIIYVLMILASSVFLYRYVETPGRNWIKSFSRVK